MSLQLKQHFILLLAEKLDRHMTGDRKGDIEEDLKKGMSRSGTR